MVIPAFVKGLEDVDDLPLVEAVKTGDHGVEFVDHVLLLVRRQRPTGDADGLRPRGKAVVRAGEASGERDDAPATGRRRDWDAGWGTG